MLLLTGCGVFWALGRGLMSFRSDVVLCQKSPIPHENGSLVLPFRPSHRQPPRAPGSSGQHGSVLCTSFGL